jgi:ABC-type uncharacterized transport system auxiliary subunit
MRFNALVVATVSILLLPICGCTGKVRYPNYYSLSIPPAPHLETAAPWQTGTVAVRRFETPAYLRQGRIVYRETPDQIGFYEYHRWATDPGAAISTAVVDSLRANHWFSLVGSYNSEQRPDYLLTGRVERLDEIDYGGRVRVEARLSAELTNMRTGAVVWSGSANQTSNVDTRNVNAVVTEMNTAVQGSIQRLLAGMQEQLSSTRSATR